MALELITQPPAQEIPSVLQLLGSSAPIRNEKFNRGLAENLAAVRSLSDPSKQYSDHLAESSIAVNASKDPLGELFAPLRENFKAQTTESLKAQAITKIRAGEDPDQVLKHLTLAKNLFDSTNTWDTNVLLKGVVAAAPQDKYEAMLDAADARPFMYIQDRMAKEGRTGVDAEDFADWAGVFLLGDISYEAGNVVDYVNENPKLFRAKDLADLGKKYQTLDPMDRETFWDEVMPKLYDEFDGNDIKMSIAISSIQAYDPETARKMNLVIDALTWAGAGLDARLLLGARTARLLDRVKSMDAIKALKNANAPGIAADAALERAAANGDALTAAKNASPYNMEGTVLDGTGVVDGLAPEMQKKLAGELNASDTAAAAGRAARSVILEQKATELDSWVADTLSKTGGKSKKALQKELEVLQSQREEMLAARESSSLSTLPEASAKLAEAETSIARVRSGLAAHEAAALGKSYARTMRAGRIPKEFESDVLAAERQALEKWQTTPKGSAARIRAEQRAAQEAEVAKIRSELDIELSSTRRLSTSEMADLKAEAAHVNAKLQEAIGAGDRAAEAELRASAADLRARFDEHTNAIALERDIELVDLRELNPAQRARVRAAGGTKTAEAAPEAAGPVRPNKSPVYSSVPAQHSVIEQYTSKIGEDLDRFASGEAFIDVAKVAFQRSEIEKAHATYSSSNRIVRETHVVNQTQDTITVRYVLDNGEETQTSTWSSDALGTWHTDDFKNQFTDVFTSLATKLLTPTAIIKRLDRDVVANSTLGGMQSASIFNNLIKIAKNIDKNLGLSREQSAAVERLLMQGDVKGEVYDAATMLRSSDIAGRQWSEAEVLAYFQWRKLYDSLWHIQDAAIQRSLQFQGYRELHVQGFDDATLMAITGRKKASETKGWAVPLRVANDQEVQNFGTRTRQGSVEHIKEEVHILDDSGYSLQTVAAEDVRAFLGKDYTLNVLHMGASLNSKDGQFVLMKLGEKVKLKPLRKQVLHYNVGYVPRLYKPGQFFVKDAKSFRTMAGFDGRAQAAAHIAKAEAAGFAKPGRLIIMTDRQLPPEAIELNKIEGAGGLWFMPRRADPIRNPVRDEMLDRLDLGQSTQAYVNSIAELLPLNEYRSGVMRQFEKAVYAVATRNKNRGVGFVDKTDILRSKIDTGDKAADAVLEYSRQYLQKQLGFRSKEESSLDAALGAAIDIMEGNQVAGGKLRNLAVWAHNQDPIARAKAAVFHVYLGCFNIAQLFVQSQNAVMASTIHPQYALPAYYDAMKMRTVLLMDREAVEALSVRSNLDLVNAHKDLEALGWFDRNIIKKALVSDKGLQQTAAFKRSGYLDSIYRQGDFVTQMDGMGGYTMQAARKILRGGAVPFEEGELWSRLISFSIAKRKFLAENPKAALDDASMQSIVQESLRINMNMQKENAALWQENWLLAIPTQFMQVQAKFWESVIGGLIRDTGTKTAGHTGLTRAEAARAGLGQLAVYGIACVPFTDQLPNHLATAYGYKDQSGFIDVQQFMEDHPTALQMYSEGMMGLYLNQLGLNVNVADRFSLVGGLDQNIVWSLAEAAIYMDDPLKREGLQLSEMAPGFGVSVRIEEKVSAATRRIIGLTLAEDPDPMQILHAMKDIAEISSSFNSQEKLRLWQKTGVLFSKSGRGRVLWDDQDMNLQTQVAIGIGFQSDAEVDQIRSQQTLSNIESDKEHAAMFFRKGMIAHMDGDEGSAASLKALAREYSLSENEYNKMAEREFKKMYSGETSDEKTRDKLRQYVLRGADVTVPLRDK